MWSFGNKREDHHDKYQQRQGPSRTSSAPRPDQNREALEQQYSPKSGGSFTSKNRMFYKSKKLPGSNSKSTPGKPLISRQHKTPSPRRDLPNTGSKPKKFIGKRWGGKKNDYLQGMSVNETSHGIEVSFHGSPSTGGSGKKNPAISLKEQIRERQRVYKTQFSIDAESAAASTNNWRPSGHRVPLMGIAPADTAYADTLQLLKDAPVLDEKTAVQLELNLLELEISSLQRDRMWLEQSKKIANRQQQAPIDNGVDKENTLVTWDAHKLLKDDAIKKQPLSISERSSLQRQRGNSLTIHLTSTRTQEAFVHNQESAKCTSLFKNDTSITTITPNSNSSSNSAATTLHHVSLLPASDKTTNDAGLYFSLDEGESEILGRLPDQLTRRFEVSGGSAAEEPEIEDLEYLVTGSKGCYFAKFQSGECWWGSAIEDADFQNIMRAWDVHRVAFGPIETFDMDTSKQADNSSNNNKISINSWIILNRDGRAVWKNLPQRLSSTLECRLPHSAAPVEVSLGPGDSYFVRFLDGSIDYSLPSKIARACDRIEERGGRITNVCLHPDVSHNFVIRHTELTR